MANNAFTQTADETVRPIESHYQAVTSLTAKVAQKNFLKSLDKTQKFEGTLYIKKPGRLRLEYTNGQIIVIDGKTVWFYSRKSEQAIKKTFTDFQNVNIPVAFLLGAAHIRDDFEVAQPEGAKPNVIDLLPKKSGAVMKKLRLQADDAGRITAMTIYDKSGNTTEITFSDVMENTSLGDRLFQFKPPKGTEIIEQ